MIVFLNLQFVSNVNKKRVPLSQGDFPQKNQRYRIPVPLPVEIAIPFGTNRWLDGNADAFSACVPLFTLRTSSGNSVSLSSFIPS